MEKEEEEKRIAENQKADKEWEETNDEKAYFARKLGAIEKKIDYFRAELAGDNDTLDAEDRSFMEAAMLRQGQKYE